MKKVLFIAKRELGTYFNSPVAYIVVVLFLTITGSLFWLNYFQEISLLSLRTFFDQAPLFLAFFAPAITMGLFSTERRSGTLELLMTMPVSDFQIVAGKFLASLALLGVVFAMTLPYPYTLSLLGDLDWGAVWAGYTGLLLLGGAYAAIGLMASSWSKDQVVSILIAFSISFFLYFIDQLVGQPTGQMARIVEYLSTNYHFQNIARGVLDIRDLVYYLSLIALALTVATLSIGARRWDRTKLSQNANVVVLAGLSLAIVIVVNAGFSQVFWRYDLTANKIYTLSPASVAAAENLSTPVEVRAFISPDLPPPFHTLAQQVDELLMEYMARSGGKISYRIISPESEEDAAESARGYGIEPVAIGLQTEASVAYRAVFKGIAFTNGERVETIPDLVMTGRPELDSFEYEFTRALLNLERQEAQKIGLLTGAGGPGHEAEFARALAPFFAQFYGDLLIVEPVEIGPGELIPEDIQALIILNITRDLSPDALFALDHFLQRGGNVGWFQSGGVLNEELFEELAARMREEGINQWVPRFRRPLETNLSEYFKTLGLELRSDGVIDRERALSLGMVMSEHGPVQVSHPATFSITDINRELPFARPFSTLVMPLPSTIVVHPQRTGEGVEIFEILRTAESSRRLPVPPVRPNYEELIREQPGEEPGPFTIGAALQGRFRSYYEREPLPPGRGEADLVRDPQEARVLIVGSGDFIGEDQELGYVGAPSALGVQFFLSIIEWLAEADELGEIRGKAMPELLVEVPKETQRSIQFINIVCVPALFLMLGTFMMRRRRKRKEALAQLLQAAGSNKR